MHLNSCLVHRSQEYITLRTCCPVQDSVLVSEEGRLRDFPLDGFTIFEVIAPCERHVTEARGSAGQSHVVSSPHGAAGASQPGPASAAQASSLVEPDTKPVINRKRRAALAGAAADEQLMCDLTDDAAGAMWASEKRGRSNG